MNVTLLQKFVPTEVVYSLLGSFHLLANKNNPIFFLANKFYDYNFIYIYLKSELLNKNNI